MVRPMNTGQNLAGHRRRTPWAGCLCAVLVWTPTVGFAQAVKTPSASADQPPAGVSVLVLTTNMKVSKGWMTSLDSQSGATLTVATGRVERFEPARTLALVAADPAADVSLGFGAFTPYGSRSAPSALLMSRALLARSGELLVTTFGERVTGSMRAGSVGADRLGWASPRLGEFEIALELVSSVRLSRPDAGETADLRPVPAGGLGTSPPLPPPGLDDVVVLQNGDTVRGLVTRLDSTVVIERDAKGPQGAGDQRFERTRVAGVVLANPQTGLRGQTLWLADGSVLSVTNAATEPTPKEAVVRVETRSGGKGAVPLSEVRGWMPQAERAAPVSSLEVTRVAPFAGRVHAPRPVAAVHADDLGTPGTTALGASDILLLGGVEAVFELPSGARRFVATAALDEDAGPWGDCELVIVPPGGVAPSRFRLTEQQPAALVDLEVVAGEMTVRIEPGRFGTVKDGVRLMRGLVLIGTGK